MCARNNSGGSERPFIQNVEITFDNFKKWFLHKIWIKKDIILETIQDTKLNSYKELVPNLWAPVIVVVSLSLPGYLAAEAVFSFLGLGVQPPASTWGILLSNATRFVTVMPSFFLITAGSLVIVVLAFNLVGDALRDALDPRADK